MNKRSLIDKHGEVGELTKDNFFKHAKTIDQLPHGLQEKLRAVGKRGPQRAPTKELVTIRLSADIVAHFRNTGSGWQTRLNDALKKAVEAGIA